MTIPIDNTREPLPRAGSDFIDELQRRSFDALTQLHSGVESLVLTDFPDYANIGDSVIALGQAEFWRRAGIQVEATYSWGTIAPAVYDSATTVAIQGGGNFGGLYPQHSEHRYRLAERLRPDTLLIQEPQSVHFASESDRGQFARRMASRPQLRLAVRDTASLAEVRDLVADVTLAPDSVHMLGRLESAAPTREAVYLLRRDDESALPPGTGAAAVDWPAMTFADRLAQRLRRTFFEGAVTRTMNRSTERWFADAAKRLATGVALLSPGETIVTDRLHAMLIGLQMGRRVIAIDNANGKLTSYAGTWLEDLDLPLAFAADLPTAAEMV
ncbi:MULTISPECIES: polysaccharide pyruvyl transferase family protein [unclassified Microbacterium]|uniref:polysaccharide pyruvyl transferase family protein n=1 Tax=unclassified Microbacterium TaxID=2609290 RepID=UPI00214CE326|nr:MULTISPECIES: polysaccharide pyruvyl transferase family protein [unclassified Microbacterium]MCR2785371.1 polysaccharide pyruvyl transferase family protein [Microbacterium sp. zg.B96]MDL5352994.1 polysaccharide pyruvyl transferase family protein [Microbacterium sp. zg-YB36]WIM16896.1 polysaccharide pyruvyl transferase family protein [Microbacterium sp. zg-B96]